MIGDVLPDGSIFEEGQAHQLQNPELSENYISSIATFKDITEEKDPILQVVSSSMEFEHSKNGNKSSSIHFTHLRLCDGSGDVMNGRLSMHLAHEGDKLVEGDIIQLRQFTPMTYPTDKESHQRSPCVVIHTYTRKGCALLPDPLNQPIHCEPLTQEDVDEMNNRMAHNSLDDDDDDGEYEDGEGDKDEYEELEEVECTPENRYCSMYGVSHVLCLCETNPVSKLNLETVRQYCYFATTDVEKMKPTWKRNMLFWWYMTNIYGICGKGHRQEPPKCLKAAIRNAYPEPSNKYKMYKPGKKGAGKTKAGRKKRKS